MKTKQKKNNGFFSFLRLSSTLASQAEKIELESYVDAIKRSNAVIEFDMSGNILTANQNFLNVMGYLLDEIKGKHHRIFVDEETKYSEEYRLFWEKLNRGEFQSDEFKRIGKNNKTVWIEASYNPVLDSDGIPYKVIKFGTDVTSKKIQNLDFEGQINAINKAQAIIEFNMDGTILSANDNFLTVMGYTLEEVKGKHHSLFVDTAYKNSTEYKTFWDKLNRGEFEASEFKRIGKNGKEVWIQASYNPILDLNGNPFKVVKFAADVTEQKIKDVKFQERIQESETKMHKILTDLQERIVIYREYISKVAQGDLRKTLKAEGDDELSELANHINDMTEGLKTIANQIITSASDIAVGINQLENTSNTQASAATEQATSVTEISSIVEEIKTTSMQTLEKAGELGESADKTALEGEKGKEAIKKMNASMKELQDKIQQVANTILNLSDKTQQIGEITEAVADIAKQSKMLALNASIEAAKAGESGKGFAVVASEVKELADKSQNSTERVQKILQDIRQTADQAVMATENGTKSVENNLSQVEMCGDIMDVLGEVIENTAIASQQIVTAIREESAGIEQVVISMREIDKSTLQFTRSTEETKNAVINLSKVSDTLKDSASIYKIGKSSERSNGD
jgi:methyl-accepting chemotaxis protein